MPKHSTIACWNLKLEVCIARRETYRITAVMNPETGGIIHLHTMEMFARDTEGTPDSGMSQSSRSFTHSRKAT
jgi:ArsR family metal-binding transcriptional regulator